jgi:hypothetical protein
MERRRLQFVILLPARVTREFPIFRAPFHWPVQDGRLSKHPQAGSRHRITTVHRASADPTVADAAFNAEQNAVEFAGQADGGHSGCARRATAGAGWLRPDRGTGPQLAPGGSASYTFRLPGRVERGSARARGLTRVVRWQVRSQVRGSKLVLRSETACHVNTR